MPNPEGMGRGFDGKANDFARKADPKTRLEAMDLEGVRVAVLYPSMGIWFGGVIDAQFAVALCRAYNDWVADYCSANPEWLKAVGILPVQNVEEARRELARAVRDLGLVGGAIPLPIPEKNVGDCELHPLHAQAQELDTPLAFHSAAGTYPPPAGSERFDNLRFGLPPLGLRLPELRQEHRVPNRSFGKPETQDPPRDRPQPVPAPERLSRTQEEAQQWRRPFRFSQRRSWEATRSQPGSTQPTTG